METQFPRVNGAQLSANLGKSVIVIGEVINASTPHEVLLRVSDGTQITVRLPSGEMVDSKFVQIMGKVRNHFFLEWIFVLSCSSSDHCFIFPYS